MKVYEAFARHRIYFWFTMSGVSLDFFAFQIKFRNSGYGSQFVLRRAPTRDLIETDQTKDSNNSPPKCFSSFLYWKYMNIN